MLSKLRKEISQTRKVARTFMKNKNPIKIKKELSPLLNSKYIPSQIYNYIDKHLYKSEELSIIIDKKTIQLRIISRKKIDPLYFEKMIAYLLFIIPYARSFCGNFLRVSIYLTPFKKKINPEHIDFSPLEFNSGVTTSCNLGKEIVVFREEEWFKVFIHETFHNFHLDFSGLNIERSKNRMKTIFPIKSTFLIFEIYCEFWACIITSLFSSFEMKRSIHTILNEQIDWSLYQTINILKWKNTNYNELITGEAYNKYNERTNVFCYQIGKMLLLYDYERFFNYLKKITVNGIDFKKNYEAIDLFVDYLKEMSRNEELIDILGHSIIKRTSLRLCKKLTN